MERGTKVGTVHYIVDDTVYLTEDIVTAESVEPIEFAWCLRQIAGRFLIKK